MSCPFSTNTGGAPPGRKKLNVWARICPPLTWGGVLEQPWHSQSAKVQTNSVLRPDNLDFIIGLVMLVSVSVFPRSCPGCFYGAPSRAERSLESAFKPDS